MKRFCMLKLLIALLISSLLVLGCTETPQETVHPDTPETPQDSVMGMENNSLLTDVKELRLIPKASAVFARSGNQLSQMSAQRYSCANKAIRLKILSKSANLYSQHL